MGKNTNIPVKAEKFWDRTAKYYDKAEKRDEQTYLNIIERTGKNLKPEDIVLDFGCGTGRIDYLRNPLYGRKTAF